MEYELKLRTKAHKNESRQAADVKEEAEIIISYKEITFVLNNTTHSANCKCKCNSLR